MTNSAAATEFARAVAPADPNQALLTYTEFARLCYLLSLLNDCSVVQIDHDESDDIDRLLYKIRNDGDDRPLNIVDDRT